MAMHGNIHVCYSSGTGAFGPSGGTGVMGPSSPMTTSVGVADRGMWLPVVASMVRMDSMLARMEVHVLCARQFTGQYCCQSETV